MYTILDIIMRNFVLIQLKPELGGAGLYDVAPRIREFLGSTNDEAELENFMQSSKGRYFFFDKFSEIFFDNIRTEISLALI